MSTADVVLGIALLVAGAAALGIGGWSAITGRRPTWLSARTIRAGAERVWGLGIGLAGIALLIQSAVNLDWLNEGVRVGSIGLMFGAVGLLIAATPLTGPSKRGQ